MLNKLQKLLTAVSIGWVKTKCELDDPQKFRTLFLVCSKFPNTFHGHTHPLPTRPILYLL